VSRTFKVEVPGIGAFTFRQRTMRDQIRIEAEAGRILGGSTENAGLEAIARTMATLGVLTVESPPGWSVDDMDPFDDGAVESLMKVHGGLRDAERRFRDGSDQGSAAQSPPA
jgi:hypothetical protein